MTRRVSDPETFARLTKSSVRPKTSERDKKLKAKPKFFVHRSHAYGVIKIEQPSSVGLAQMFDGPTTIKE